MRSENDGILHVDNEHLPNWEVDLIPLALTYMICFGDAPGVLEGGVNSGGSRISLSDYLRFCLGTRAFANLVKPQLIDEMTKLESPLPSTNAFQLMEWLTSLSADQSGRIFGEVLSEHGFSAVNTVDAVVNRFKSDFRLQDQAIPITAIWRESPDSMPLGFDIGIVVKSSDYAAQIVKNMPYMESGHPDIGRQVSEFISEIDGLDYPILMLYETAIIPERRGTVGGSRRGELALYVRESAVKHGAKYAVGVTYPTSEILRDAGRRNSLVKSAKTRPETGGYSYLFVTDILKEIQELKDKIK
jgi:hypothetical protein